MYSCRYMHMAIDEIIYSLSIQRKTEIQRCVGLYVYISKRSIWKMRYMRQRPPSALQLCPCYDSRLSPGMISRICRMITVPTESVDHIVSPSGEKAIWYTPESLCPENVATRDPPLVLHNRTTPSNDADAKYFPHGEKRAQCETCFLFPLNENTSRPVCASPGTSVRSDNLSPLVTEVRR